MNPAFRRTPSAHCALLLLIFFSLALTLVNSQTRSMCLTQLSLTSQACSLLPISNSRGHHALGVVELLRHHHHRHHHHRHHHHRHHDHDHDEDDDDDEREEEGGGRRQSSSHDDHWHHHWKGGKKGKGRKKGQRGTWVEQECCRWLRELDSICVCHTMKRMPKFLLRPHRNLTLSVEGVCHVTYSCAGGY